MDSNTNNCEKNISISTIMEDHQAKEDDANFLYAVQLVSVSILPTVLKVAIELDLLELIKKQGTNALVSPAELAAQIPATNPEAHIMLDRILSLLTSYSILNCTLKTPPDGGIAERLYSLAPVGKYFTKDEDGGSLAPLVLMCQDKVLMDIWYHLKDAILEGGSPFNKTYGMSLFEYNATDSRFSKIFNEGMSNNSTIFLKRVVERYDGFKGLKSLVDVGGGIASSLNIIISKYPTIKGINFDLPQVIQHAQPHPGLEHIGGDMFVSVPKGDAIFMKWILHNWSDSECVKLLKNCHEALPHEGKVIVVDYIIPEKPNTDLKSKLDFQVDVVMLAYIPGAKERREKEFQALAKEAGFKEFRKVCLISSVWVMEFCK